MEAEDHRLGPLKHIEEEPREVQPENKFVDAVTDIANEVRFGKSPLIVFADDVNSEFVSSHITSLTTAIDLSS